MTPERRAKFFAELDAEFGHLKRKPEAEPKAPKPKVVAEAGQIVRDVSVRVSPADPNFRSARADGFVRINFAEAERQRAWAEQDRAVERTRRQAIDPFGYGHWGPAED